jgi:hypothetical protein
LNVTSLEPKADLEASQPLAVYRALDDYMSVVQEICPGVPREILDVWTLTAVDALALSEFLTAVGRPVSVVDVGTFVGGSAFLFGSHPAVVHVMSIDPNPLISDEVNDKRDMLGTWLDGIENTELRVQDIAAHALARFPEVADSIQLLRGHLGAPSDLASVEVTKPVALPEPDDGATQLVVFVDGGHTAEAVYQDLREIFAQRPDAVAVLDDCRYAWGPFVQAGVARFLDEQSAMADGYRFRLFADLVPSLGRANLGTIYKAGVSRLEDILQAFARRFSTRMDLMRLLEREDELLRLQTASVASLKELEPLRNHARQLEEGLERTDRELAAARARIVDLEQSTSWRVTAPLRRIRQPR